MRAQHLWQPKSRPDLFRVTDDVEHPDVPGSESSCQVDHLRSTVVAEVPAAQSIVIIAAGQDPIIWSASATFCTSPQKPDIQQIPTPLFNRFIESLAYAA